MAKYKICKHTLHFEELATALDSNNIEFKVKDCLKKCSKCRSKLLVKKDEDYISAKTIEKLLSKLDLDIN